jgi:peptidyl-tRNA hydrolase
MDAAAYVLRDFGSSELELANQVIEEAAEAVETFLAVGIDQAMTRHNRALE